VSYLCDEFFYASMATNDDNGCISYYAAKKVVVDVNVNYYNILRENNIVGI
jgi:hypothetical protein